MTVLRISSYHAGKIPDYLEKQLHKMSFYQENVIICEENELAGQIGPASDGQFFDIGVSRVRFALGSEGFPRRGEEGLPPSPPQLRREKTRSRPTAAPLPSRTPHQNIKEVILSS